MSREQFDLTVYTKDANGFIKVPDPAVLVHIFTDAAHTLYATTYNARTGNTGKANPLTTDAEGRVTAWLDPGRVYYWRVGSAGRQGTFHTEQGPAGPQGPQGIQGVQGTPGTPGSAGPKGDTGNTGPAGPEGAMGPRGFTGNAGPQGIQGIPGASGPVGPKGDPGAKGDPGTPGTQGPQGPTGQTGQEGPTGPRGFQGDPGTPGAKGDKGDKGDPGNLIWRGGWLTGTSYVAGDVVSSDGRSWVALRSNQGVTPVQGLDWDLMADKGAAGSGGAGTAATSVTDMNAFGLASVVGVGTNFAREDHRHSTMPAPNIPVPASSITNVDAFGLAAIVGTATSFAREDHRHATMADPVPAHLAAADPHTQYALESALPGPASTVVSETSFGQAAAVGTGTGYARTDHTHGTPAAPAAPPSPASSVVGPQAFGAGAAIGTGTTYARADHAHGLPANPAPSPATTVTGPPAFGAAAAVGTAAGYAREDHVHGLPASPAVPGAATTVVAETAFGQASAVGTGTLYARNDHTHGTPAAPTAPPSPAATVTGPPAFGAAAVVGTGTTYARHDHIHGMPADPITAHVAAADPHGGYFQEGNYATKGQIAVAAGASSWVMQPVGANGTVLTADSTQTGGVIWSTPSGGSGTPSSTVVTEQNYGQSSFAGSSTNYARGDHSHGTPTHPDRMVPNYNGGADMMTIPSNVIEGTAAYNSGGFNLALVGGSISAVSVNGTYGWPFMAFVTGAVANNYVTYMGSPKAVNYYQDPIMAGMVMYIAGTTGVFRWGLMTTPTSSEPTDGVFWRVTNGGNPVAVVRVNSADVYAQTYAISMAQPRSLAVQIFGVNDIRFYMDGTWTHQYTGTTLPANTAMLRPTINLMTTAAASQQWNVGTNFTTQIQGEA